MVKGRQSEDYRSPLGEGRDRSSDGTPLSAARPWLCVWHQTTNGIRKGKKQRAEWWMEEGIEGSRFQQSRRTLSFPREESTQKARTVVW